MLDTVHHFTVGCASFVIALGGSIAANGGSRDGDPMVNGENVAARALAHGGSDTSAVGIPRVTVAWVVVADATQARERAGRDRVRLILMDKAQTRDHLAERLVGG